jgi:ribosomal protein L12E/L44/L45/RPP1/RPP2
MGMGLTQDQIRVLIKAINIAKNDNNFEYLFDGLEEIDLDFILSLLKEHR